MANDKKFIVKNGLLTPENVVVGSNTDTGEKLQVTGTSKLSGSVDISQADFTKASLSVTNSGGHIFDSPIAEFKGDSESLQITNTGVGDYKLVNSRQNNGIIFYDNTVGLRLIYNNQPRLDINSNGNRFYGLSTTTIDNNRIITTADEGPGNGFDADTVDGLEADQFVRSDVDDIMSGNYVVQQNFTVQGDFTVNGNTTYLNTEEILLSDNIITLNANYEGSNPTENAGIEIERGTLDNPKLLWDESNDFWKLKDGNAVDLGRIITTADEGPGNGFDADTVDGLEAAQFLRSDIDDTANGNITVLGDITVGDNTGGAQIFFNGAGNNRTIYSENGVIGFLNQAFNYSARSDAQGNWIVQKDVLAGENVIANTGSVTAATSVTAGTDVIGQRFVDADDNTYLVDPASTSTLNTVGIDSDLFHNGDINTKLNFSTNTIKLDTAGATRFTANNSGTFVNNLTAADTVVGDNVYAITEMESPIFYDADDRTYYGDFASTSRINTISLDGQIVHDGDTDTFLNFNDADSFEIVTGGSQRLSVTNSNIESSVDLRAPRFVDADDTDYYLDPNNATLALNAKGELKTEYSVSITGIDGSGNITPATDEVRVSGYGLIGNRNELYITNAGGTVQIGTGLTHDAEPGLTISDTRTTSFNDVYAPTYYDSKNETFYGDYSLTSRMNNISLVGEIGNDGDADTYIHFNSADSFQVVAGGSNIITANTTTVVIGGDLEITGETKFNDITANTITATTAVFSPIYYDLDDDSYFGDFAGTSVFNRISIDDYVTHNDNTNTYLGFSAPDTIVAATNNVVRLTIDNTDITSTLDGTFPNLYAERFYDSEEPTYFTEPGGTSRVNNIALDGDIISDGDTDTFIRFPGADQFGVTTGGTQRLAVNNTFVSASNELRAPIFRDSDNTSYYLDPADASLSATLNGAVRIGNITNNTRWSDTSGNGGISLLSHGDITATSNPLIAISGNNGNEPLMYLNRISVGNNPFNNSNRIIQFNTNGVSRSKLSTDLLGNLYWILGTGLQQGTWDGNGNALLVVDAGGDIVVGDSSATYASSDNASVTSGRTIANNKVHIAGSIQLNGNDDAIVFGRGTSSFLMNNELGFGQGGGFYMDNTTTIKTRNDKDISTGGDVYASRFIDADNNTYFVDPAGNSQLTRIDIDDYIRHRGNLTTYFGFPANNQFGVWTNNVQRLDINNTSANFAVDVYAPKYFDSNDNTFFAEPGGTSLLKFLNVYSGAATGELNVGRSASERIRQLVTNSVGFIQYWQDETDSTDHSLRFEILSSSSGTNTFQFNRPISMTGAGAAAHIFARRFVDADNTAFYVDPASTSLLNTIDLGGSIHRAGDTNTRIEFNAANQFRVVTDGTQRLSVNNTATTGTRIDATTEMRAPIYYDSNDTNFYVDPNSTSRFNQAIFTNATPLRFQTTSTALFDHESNSTSAAFRMNKGGTTLTDSTTYAVLQLSRTNHNNSDTSAGAALYFVLKDSNGTPREYAGILGRKTVAGASGGELQFMSFNRSIMASMNGTFFQHNTQLRAPIFFDSNNTAYFVDPNGTTALRSVGAWLSDSAAWSGDAGASQGKLQYSNNRWFINAGSNSSRLVQFRRGGTDLSWIDNNGVFQGDISGNAGTVTNGVYTVGDQSIAGLKTFTTGISITGASGLNMNNRNITNVNHITIADPGQNEGIEWLGGNNWKIYESPDNLANSAGNLQFVTGTTRRMTLRTDGRLQLGEQANATNQAVRADRTLTGGSGINTIGNLTANRTISVDSTVVRTSGNQTIGGVKTFTSGPILDGVNLTFRAPVTTGGWARGNFFNPAAGGNNYGGIGLLGGGTAADRFFIAFGTSPWSSGTGLYVNTSGDVGIGITDPTERLHVNGKIRIGTQATATTDAVRADRSIATGSGLSGGGNLTANRTLAVDGTVVRTSGNQTIGGNKTISGNLIFTAGVRDALDLNNNNIIGINHMIINDPGRDEGLAWAGGNGWAIYESPDNLGNAAGNLQFVSGGPGAGATRRMTLRTDGRLQLGQQANATNQAVRADRTLTGGDGINAIGNLTANRTISVDSTVVRTSGNQTINGVKSFSSLRALNAHNIDPNSLNAINNDSLRWNNQLNTDFIINNSNNALAITLGGNTNQRRASIQVGHGSAGFAQFLGDLYLNPLGGNVGIGTTSPSQRLHVNGNVFVGSTSDGTSDTKKITVESRGYAALDLIGDRDNVSGEPGGASILLSQDGGLIQGMLGIVQNANQDGRGGTYTGTTTNSVYFGHKNSSNLHLGTNNQVRFTINGSGNITATGSITANSFSGSLDANNLSGTIPAARLSGTYPITISGSGTNFIDGTVSGPNGSTNQIRFGSAQGLGLSGASNQFELGFLINTGGNPRNFFMRTTGGSFNLVTDRVTAAFVGNLTGNASTVTNGVYTSGNQTITGIKTFNTEVRIGTSARIRQNTTTWTGNAGSGWGKLEYHSNRWYINAGSNSSEVVRFRRGGTDVANINNSGQLTLAAGSTTSHAVRGDRTIATSGGLTGGGNLTANRTISAVTASAGFALMASRGRQTGNINDFRESGVYGLSGSNSNQPPSGQSFDVLLVARNSDVGCQLHLPRQANRPISFRGWSSSGGSFTGWRNLVDTSLSQSIGGTKTFTSTLRTPSPASSWIGGHRGNSSITITTPGTTSSFHGWVSQRTPSGGFALGTLNNNLYITWATAANINNNTNSKFDVAVFRSDGRLVLGNNATATNQAVRADRSISTGSGISGGGNLTANRTFSVDSSVIRTSGNQSMSGTKTFTGQVVVGNGSQSIASDADITIRRGNSFAGMDFKSTRTSGNIGGLRFYNSANSMVSQLLFQTDGNSTFDNRMTATRVDGTSQMRTPDIFARQNTTYRVRPANLSTSQTRVRAIRVDRLGVGTNNPGTTGQILATNNITAFSSDGRLKNNLIHINRPLEKISKLNGVHFDWDIEECERWNFHPPKKDTGLIAQEVQDVLPDAVKPAPFDLNFKGGSKSGKNYLTVQYEKVVPLLVEGIKELKAIIERQNKRIDELENK